MSRTATPRLQVKTLRTRQLEAPKDRPPSLISDSTTSDTDESAHVATPPERSQLGGMDLNSLKKALKDVQATTIKRAPAPARTVYKQSKETPLFLTEPFVSNALVKGKFKIIAQCPAHVDRNEWIAVNLIDFWGRLNDWYSVIFSVCTCQTMSVAPSFDLFWRDQRQRPAFTYCDSTLSWVETLSKNRSVFPTEQGRDFAPEFPEIAGRIYVQLLMLFSHVYYAHPMDLIHLEAESHFNSLCAHYVTFGLINGLLAPDAREINPNSRKGYTLGRLVAKWSEIGIISPDLLRPKVPEE